MNIETIRNEIRNRKPKKSTSIKVPTYLNKYLSKFLIAMAFTLVTLIVLKGNKSLQPVFYKEVYDTNFSFATVNNLYEKYLGSPLPFKDFFKDIEPVFNEKLIFSETNKYIDGVKLTVEKNYLVANQLSGLVVFIGEKEGYGNTVVIQQVNGIDLWYSNVTDVSVKLYDYVEKGTLIGTTIDNYLYLVFKKDGTALNYEDYI